MNIEILGKEYMLIAYCLGHCHITEVVLPESGETIARSISNSSSINSKLDAIQKAQQRLSYPRGCDFELMVGG